jgi:RNA recognition motif-containing protein
VTTLFAGNLSPEATDSDSRTVFSTYGEIGYVHVALIALAAPAAIP